MVALFLFAVGQMAPALGYSRNGGQQRYLQTLHTVAQGITYPLLLLSVVSLLYDATETLATRHLIRMILGFGVPLVILGSFAAHHYTGAANSTVLMTLWMRDLNFCAAGLDLFLWALLLAGPHKDPHALLLAGGLGIVFAGDAVTNAVRSIAIHIVSRWLWTWADVLAIVADTAWLYVWWQAFRREAAALKLAQDKRKAVVSG
jgi:hypothetical protein